VRACVCPHRCSLNRTGCPASPKLGMNVIPRRSRERHTYDFLQSIMTASVVRDIVMLGRHSCHLGPPNCVVFFFFFNLLFCVLAKIMRGNATSIYNFYVKACQGSHEIIKDFPAMFSSSFKHYLIFVHQKRIASVGGWCSRVQESPLLFSF